LVQRVWSSHAEVELMSSVPLDLLFISLRRLWVTVISVKIADERWVSCNEAILCSQVHIVVHFPVDVAYTPCWMEQSLQGVEQDAANTKRNSKSLNTVHHAVDNMWGNLEDIREQVVQHVCQSIFTAHMRHTKR